MEHTTSRLCSPPCGRSPYDLKPLPPYLQSDSQHFAQIYPCTLNTFRRYGRKVKHFRSDAEAVLKDGQMGRYLEERSRLYHETSTSTVRATATSAVRATATLYYFVERYVHTRVRATATLFHSQLFLRNNAIVCKNRTANEKCGINPPMKSLLATAT